MIPHSIEILSTLLFSLAVFHTFLVKPIHHLSRRFEKGSLGRKIFSGLGNVELVFCFWAMLLLGLMAGFLGIDETATYVSRLSFSEPFFVFVIIVICATRPIVNLAENIIGRMAKRLPFASAKAQLFSTLVAGPLLGSFITEPAAMTLTAMVLKENYFDKGISHKLKYSILAVLFVNVSIGGVLTHFAAPPVLLVARAWGWGTTMMLSQFGWKAVLAIVANAALVLIVGWREVKEERQSKSAGNTIVPMWLSATHVVFVILCVMTAHHVYILASLFALFLAINHSTKSHQEPLKVKDGFLVGLFLSGLLILGSFQGWWLKKLLVELSARTLFLGATLLTAFVDNAALTYLGTQVPDLAFSFQYALVAGAVAGGGLTVIANAPNPAGFALLEGSFGEDGISPFALFLFASIPTGVAMASFWLLS